MSDTQKQNSPMRAATVERRTLETDIGLTINLDGTGAARVETGIGFFDHMLSAMCRFGKLDLCARCAGDLAVDGHHTVEDVGLCFGEAIAQALGDKRGITRAAHAFLPMDEALAFAAVDISGRPYLAWDVPLPPGMLGGFDPTLALEFFRAVTTRAGITLHLRVTPGNAHHMLEAAFKAFGRALRLAAEMDPRETGVPSTKGTL